MARATPRSTGGHRSLRPYFNPADPGGYPDLGSVGRWLGVVVSVKDGTGGAEESLIERAGLNGRPYGADLFSYYFEESTGLAASVAGATLVEQTRETLGFPLNGTEDVSGLDFGLAINSFSGALPGDPMFPNTDKF